MESGMIYKLIGQAISKIGAIGKDKTNTQQGFKYRGIDQVYNALNPVMAELGIFIAPEVIDQKREERVTQKGAILTYTLLTMRYTVYAPDGSSVSMTVVGEGMDSGDKSSNKAMSVAMKYAMFQLFCIPTEEMKDPDADVYQDILPRGTAPTATVTMQATVPAEETPGKYVKRMIGELQREYGGAFNFVQLRGELIAAGKVQDVPSATMKMDEAISLVSEMRREMEARKAG